MLKRIVLALGLLLALPAFAVEPDEMLADPALEARAREVSKDLRCLVCRNESIDESNADLAKELRVLVRERLTEGDSNQEVKDYLVDLYGEFVLLNPKKGGANALLWYAGPIMLLVGLLIGIFYVRGRRRAGEAPTEALSAAEAARLKEIMGE